MSIPTCPKNPRHRMEMAVVKKGQGLFAPQGLICPQCASDQIDDDDKDKLKEQLAVAVTAMKLAAQCHMHDCESPGGCDADDVVEDALAKIKEIQG